MASLAVNIGGHEYIDLSSFMDVGYEQTILDGVVYVDGSDLVNHYRIEKNADWITIERVRNSVRVIFAKNDGYDSRSGVIAFYHNLDSTVSVSLVVTQAPCEYTISADVTDILFDTLLDQTDADSETCTVNVATTNGSCDFIVASVVEYIKKNEDDEIYYIAKYDKGLKIRKIGKTMLEITNHGKISLYYDNYYVIKLCHRNNPKSNVGITVRYEQPNNETGFGLDNGD